MDGQRRHAADDVVVVDEGAVAGIQVMCFSDIQRCLMALAADQVAIIAVVDSFSGIPSRVRKLNQLCELCVMIAVNDNTCLLNECIICH